MYKIIFLFIIGLFLSCQNNQEKKQNQSDPVLEKIAGKDYANLIEIPTTPDGEIDSSIMARITFEETQFYFDTIFTGDKVNHTFHFKNEG